MVVGTGLTASLAGFLKRRRDWCRLAIIADEEVARRHAGPLLEALKREGLHTELLTFPPGEASKTRETKAGLEDRLLAAGMGRDAAILALGGGVTIDLAGFTAATYMRGIPFVALPTTVLAVVDSSIGGKTAVDTPAGKNLIGAFHPPAAIFADIAWLATLPADQRRWGLAEAVKHGLIASVSHLEALDRNAPGLLAGNPETLEQILAASAQIKVEFVAADEREADARKALNFGHTVGHALERLSGWRMPHGEAVARGLLAESLLSARQGLLAREEVEEIRRILSRFGLPDEPFQGLPVDLTPEPAGRLSADRFLDATRMDKKAREGRVEYVLLEALGRVALDPERDGAWSRPLDDAVVREVLFP